MLTIQDISDICPPAAINYETDALYQIPLSRLIADPDQPRQLFDDESIDEMVVSIKKYGVLQPVIFRKGDDDRLILISGERRFRACQIAEVEDIPAIYHDGGNNAEIALVENLLREDLTPMEESEALLKLKESKSYNNEDLSNVIGKAVSTISEILSLNKLPEEVKNICKQDRRFSRRRLVEVAKIDTTEGMTKAFEKLQNEGGTREEVRAERKQPSPAEKWIKKVKAFTKAVDRVDFTSSEIDRDKIGSELKKLAELIQTKVRSLQ